jgi:hypothetical protein
MNHLSKREQAVFLMNLGIAVGTIITVAYLLLQHQQLENCWSKYQTEVESIRNCETKP